jgi:metallo-beta-lactamase class B
MKKITLLILFTVVSINIFAIDIIKIKSNVWIHVSYAMYDGIETPSNGLFIKTNDGVILFDTAWDDKQTKEICDYITSNIDKRILMCIITHAHIDRLGGVKYLRNQNIDVYMTKQTKDIAETRKFSVGNKFIEIGQSQFLKYGIISEYYGAAHSKDNIVLYLKTENILFGGCLVKAMDWTSLGSLEDADIMSWRKVIDQLIQKYTLKDTIVVPGHSNYGGIELLQHTKYLLN